MIEEEIAHLQGHLGPDFLDGILRHLDADLPQQAETEGGHRLEAAAPLADGAGVIGAGLGGGAQALPGELQQANLDRWPTDTRALSVFRLCFRAASTSFWCFLSLMSMKSMTTRPPRSRRRSCRATSWAASRLDFRAVSSSSF